MAQQSKDQPASYILCIEWLNGEHSDSAVCLTGRDEMPG